MISNSLTFSSTNISSTQSKFGLNSYYFDGSSSTYVSMPNSDAFNFGTSDFTIDWWEYRTSTGGYCPTIARDLDYCAFMAGWEQSGYVTVSMSSNGTSWDIAQEKSLGTITTNEWVHYAIVRNGNNFYTFRNGTQTDTWTSSAALLTTTSPLYIGKWKNWNFGGYVDEVRISNVARWTSAFAAPTDRYVYDASTVALLHADGDIATGKEVTPVGTPQIIKNVTPFTRGSSILLNGSTDYVSVAKDSTLDLGGNNFTIEQRVKFVSLPSSGNFVCFFNLIGATDDHHYINIDMYNDSGTYKIGADCQDGSALWGITRTAKSLATDVWYHIALVRNGTAIDLYIDGVKLAGTTFSGSITTSVSNLYYGMYYGSGGPTRFFNGYIAEARILNGQAKWTTDFTPPAEQYSILEGGGMDDFVKLMVHGGKINGGADSYNILLLHGDGADSSTTITDSSNSARTITPQGDAQIKTAQKKFGTGSVNFNTTGYLDMANSSDFNLGSDDFTIDFWINSDLSQTYGNLICARGSTNTVYYLYTYVTSAGQVYVYIGNGSSRTVQNFGTISANTWTHFAIVRNGTLLKSYLDGVEKASSTISGGMTYSIDAGQGLRIGAYGETPGEFYSGYIDEVRISKGIARWTSAFTPPTYAYSSIAITDESVGGHAITVYADTKYDDSQYKFSTSSIRFDGVDDYFSVADSDFLSFGNGEFTIDFWVRFNSLPTNGNFMYFFDQHQGTDNNNYHAFGLYNNGGDLQFSSSSYMTGYATGWTTSPVTLTTTDWFHLAVIRSASTVRMAINGTRFGSAAASTLTDLSAPMFFGCFYMNGSSITRCLDGWMDEIRITKGLARWTADFTPSSQRYYWNG